VHRAAGEQLVRFVRGPTPGGGVVTVTIQLDTQREDFLPLSTAIGMTIVKLARHRHLLRRDDPNPVDNGTFAAVRPAMHRFEDPMSTSPRRLLTDDHLGTVFRVCSEALKKI
jgi:hypothetical protein